MRPLTERDMEVLNELVGCQDAAVQRMERNYAMSIGFAPLEFGGSNGSHHGKTALKLVGHGFVEAKKRGNEWGDLTTRDARGSNVYRPTPAGREATTAYRKLKNGFASGGMKRKWGSTVPSTRHLTDNEKHELRLACHLEMPA